MRTIRIFDTTLRDGEQAAGGALTLEEKIEIGRQLQKLGVTVIEAGFPSTSPGDFEAVQFMSREYRDVEIAALSGFKEEQLSRTWEALQDAERGQPRGSTPGLRSRFGSLASDVGGLRAWELQRPA